MKRVMVGKDNWFNPDTSEVYEEKPKCPEKKEAYPVPRYRQRLYRTKSGAYILSTGPNTHEQLNPAQAACWLEFHGHALPEGFAEAAAKQEL